MAVLDAPSAARFGELAIKHGIKLGVLPEAVHHSRNTRQAEVPHKVTKSAEDTVRMFGLIEGIWDISSMMNRGRLPCPTSKRSKPNFVGWIPAAPSPPSTSGESRPRLSTATIFPS